MQLNSLLGNGRSSGIKKMESTIQKDKDVKISAERDNEMIHSVHTSNSVLPSKIEEDVYTPKTNKAKKSPGRPKVYKDPRYISNEPARVSAYVKLKLQSIADQKFDGCSTNQAIDELIKFYVEQALPKEEQIFINKLVDDGMEELKTSKKFKKFFE